MTNRALLKLAVGGTGVFLLAHVFTVLFVFSSSNHRLVLELLLSLLALCSPLVRAEARHLIRYGAAVTAIITTGVVLSRAFQGNLAYKGLADPQLTITGVALIVLVVIWYWLGRRTDSIE